MAGDVAVVFSADTGELEASFAMARASTQGLTREINSLAREMRSTGASADGELGQKLNSLANELAGAKGHMAELSAEMRGHAVAAAEAGGAVERLGQLGELAKRGLELA